MSSCPSDAEFAELKRCFADRTWRLNNLYWITDKRSNRVKFKLNTAQAKLVKDMHNRNVTLKCRQKGITTFWCIFALDAALFNSNFSAGIIAHNLDDAKEIFRTKVKFPYDNLPESIRKARPASQEQAGMLVFDNNSKISVSTSFRSGTLNLLHVSELGKIAAKYPDRAREIKSGALEAVPMDGIASYESTAEGACGYFYDVCKEAQDHAASGNKLTPLDFKFHFFPWWIDDEYEMDPEGVVITAELEKYFTEIEANTGASLSPRKRAWYAVKSKNLGDDMLREYPSTPEEAFRASVQGAYYSAQFSRVRAEKRIVNIPIEDGIPVNTAWDLGMDDYTAIVFYQNVGREIRFIDYYENNGEGLSHYKRVLEERGYLYGNHYFPHDIKVRELSGDGKSRKESLEAMGIRVTIAPNLAVSDGIEASRKLLSMCWFDEKRCATLVSRLESYRKSWNDKLGVFMEQPVHDEASHTADAFRYAAITHEFDTPHGYLPPGQKHKSRVL